MKERDEFDIKEIKATLAEHRPDLLAAVETGKIVLLTARQLRMRSRKGFIEVVGSLVDKERISWKAAYSLTEEEYLRIYGERRYANLNTFYESKRKHKNKNST